MWIKNRVSHETIFERRSFTMIVYLSCINIDICTARPLKIHTSFQDLMISAKFCRDDIFILHHCIYLYRSLEFHPLIQWDLGLMNFVTDNLIL